jgi:hypothetical protein
LRNREVMGALRKGLGHFRIGSQHWTQGAWVCLLLAVWYQVNNFSLC